MTEPGMINNTRWLEGHAAYERGEPIPWGDKSARLGWLVARDTDPTVIKERTA